MIMITLPKIGILWQCKHSSFHRFNEFHTNPNSSLQAWGIQTHILQLIDGLSYLHNSAKILHGNLTPSVVFITPSRNWKIAGFAFSVAAREPVGYFHPVYEKVFSNQWSLSIHVYLQKLIRSSAFLFRLIWNQLDSRMSEWILFVVLGVRIFF